MVIQKDWSTCDHNQQNISHKLGHSTPLQSCKKMTCSTAVQTFQDKGHTASCISQLRLSQDKGHTAGHFCQPFHDIVLQVTSWSTKWQLHNQAQMFNNSFKDEQPGNFYCLYILKVKIMLILMHHSMLYSNCMDLLYSSFAFFKQMGNLLMHQNSLGGSWSSSSPLILTVL